MNARKPLQLRLPDDVKHWLAQSAARNGSSQNSEVIRALRAQMGNQFPQGSGAVGETLSRAIATDGALGSFQAMLSLSTVPNSPSFKHGAEQ